MPQHADKHANKLNSLIPAKLLTDNTNLFDDLPDGDILDLACGSGRNGLYVAKLDTELTPSDSKARKVIMADRNVELLQSIEAIITDHHLNAQTWQTDFELPERSPLAGKSFAAILVFRYLHRPLFQSIKDAVIPGGLVFYETFTIDQPKYGRPTNPDFLLQPEELKAWFEGWEILTYDEGVPDQRPPSAIARMICRKPLNQTSA